MNSDKNYIEALSVLSDLQLFEVGYDLIFDIVDC